MLGTVVASGATWRRGVAAECHNVVIKLGGIGMPRTGCDGHARDIPIGSGQSS